MEVQPIINIILNYQRKYKADIEQYKYYKIINDKEKANEMIDIILKDREELGNFLDTIF